MLMGFFLAFFSLAIVGCDNMKSEAEETALEYVADNTPQDVLTPSLQEAVNKTVNWSPNGFPSGQCTWFADGTANDNGWRLQFSRNYGRDGWTWYDLVTNATKSSTPQVGSIMVFNAWSGNPYGHVAWVTGVSGNNVTVRHANWDGKGSVRTDTFVRSGNNVKVSGGTKTYPIRGYLVRVAREGFGSLASLSVPTSVTRGRTFSVSTTIRETNGGNLSLPTVAIAVHNANGTYLFDCLKQTGFALPPNASRSMSASCNVKTSLPKGRYLLYVKGQRSNGSWFNFTPFSGVSNPKNFTAN